jgi:6-phosphofructokinase 1
MNFVDTQDASGNKLLLDVGLWLSQKIKVRFLVQTSISVNVGTNEALY